MYRCQVCNRCSKPGEARRTYVIQRGKRRQVVVRRRSPFGNLVTVPLLEVGTEIAAEIALCGPCHADVRECGGLRRLLDARRALVDGELKTRNRS